MTQVVAEKASSAFLRPSLDPVRAVGGDRSKTISCHCSPAICARVVPQGTERLYRG